MYAAFPPIDYRPSVTPPVARLRAGTGDEQRTAGPMPVHYLSENKEIINHAAAIGDQGAETPGGWTFGDVLDVINPLQHIPLVNLVYRGLTGDTIGDAAQIIGGGLFGGPIGAVAGTASALIARQTGQSPTEAVLGAFNGKISSDRAARAYVDLSAPPAKRYNFNLAS